MRQNCSLIIVTDAMLILLVAEAWVNRVYSNGELADLKLANFDHFCVLFSPQILPALRGGGQKIWKNGGNPLNGWKRICCSLPGGQTSLLTNHCVCLFGVLERMYCNIIIIWIMFHKATVVEKRDRLKTFTHQKKITLCQSSIKPRMCLTL